MPTLEPATDLDSNVWYQLSELAVDDNDGDLKSMLKPTAPGGDLRVGTPNGNSYWQFQKIGDKPGRYQLRCSDTTVKKQLSICYRPEVIDAKLRTRPCLMPIEDSEMQQWDISLWDSDTYRLTNVKNGTKWNLDCIPNGPVILSSDLEGAQPRQHWLMSSVGLVNNEMYSTVYTAPPESTGESTATAGTTGSDSTAGTATADSNNPSNTNSESNDGGSSSGGLSTGAVAGISVGVTLGVVALALAAFFFWRRNKRKYQVAGTGSPDSPGKPGNSPMAVSPNPAYSSVYSAEKNNATPAAEMMHEQRPVELSTGQHQRHELA
ncbi:transmembrane alpha-helix [Fusarium denticulatum]|uniref:Transmembrane alpha-helix n=1 Tax=Fusarium denticulatum TaxID=48507 RepID=A0A8H5TZZ9_9HYPO|nr:transmembrane alpha-helix [Fusarium denticulatum]